MASDIVFFRALAFDSGRHSCEKRFDLVGEYRAIQPFVILAQRFIPLMDRERIQINKAFEIRCVFADTLQGLDEYHKIMRSRVFCFSLCSSDAKIHEPAPWLPSASPFPFSTARVGH